MMESIKRALWLLYFVHEALCINKINQLSQEATDSFALI